MNLSYYKEILNKLDKLYKKEKLNSALNGIITVFIAGILVYTFLCFVEMIAHFSAGIRTVLIFSFGLAFVISFIIFFIVPILKYFKIIGNPNYQDAAKKVGNNFYSIKDDLLNAMQLVISEESKNHFSNSLIDAAFKNIYDKTKELKFETIINFQRIKKLSYYLAGIFISIFVMLIFIPGLKAASFRLVNFQREFIPPPKFILYVKPGNVKITKGEPLKVIVKAVGKIPKDINLAVKNNDETNFEMQKLLKDSIGVFYYNFPAVRNSFKYFASADKINSDVYEIEVIDRPIIKTLDEIITPPSYSHMPQIQQKDNGNITSLTGSVVDLSISSTRALKKAWVEFSDSSKIGLNVSSNNASGRFVIKKDGSYFIKIVDENGNDNLSPINYSITSVQDEYPSIEIIYPNQNTSLGSDNRQQLNVKIADDFGFTKLLLNYRLSQSKYNPIQKDFKALEIPINKTQTQQEVSYLWNLSNLNLTSDDEVTYYLEVFDNDMVKGPKSTKTSSFIIRVPSLNELLNSADNSQSKGIKDMEETLQKAENLKKKIDDLNNELKRKDKDITWQEKQKIEQTITDFKELQQKVSDISQSIQKMQENLQKNNLLSKETMEKYMELRKLFNEMNNDEMKKALEQLQSVLQNMNRQMTQNAFQNMQINEEQLKESIERTMNLMKRIQIEQKIDEILKRAEEIVKNQNEIKKETNSENASKQKDMLGEKQNDLTNSLKDFSKQLDDLSKKVNGIKDLPKDQLEKLRNEFKQQQNEELSQQASQDISQSQMQNAQQNQSQIENNMQKMQKSIKQYQQSVSSQTQMQAFKEMMRLTDNLITLSKQQEQLKNQTSSMEQSSSSFNENAQQQNNIRRNLEKIMAQLSSLSQKTFAITPEMGKTLGDADRQMSEATQNLQNRNSGAASENQKQAMASVNESASLLKSSMEQMMKGGGQGGGMPSLMQQLQQMTGQQMSLNNLTQALQQMMKGNLSMQQQAQLQRLAQQQDALRKSLEQLNKEAMQSGQSKNIPGNLGDIAKSMQEVVKNMNSDNIDQKVLQQQEHILSRLLDAQHSINERDYENERESQSGKDIVEKPPAELNLMPEKNNNVKDELNKAVQEGYSKDYEILIRKYFDALQKSNSK